MPVPGLTARRPDSLRFVLGIPETVGGSKVQPSPHPAESSSQLVLQPRVATQVTSGEASRPALWKFTVPG